MEFDHRTTIGHEGRHPSLRAKDLTEVPASKVPTRFTTSP